MSGPWSAEQREWLQALGHPAVVLVGGDGDHGTAPNAGSDADGVAEPAATPARGNPACTPLHRALLKATGRAGPAAEQLLRELGVATGNRMDAAAKRALWPRLRQSRGSRPA